MRFSYWIPNDLPWSETLEQARHAEAIGYDGVWYADHFMPNAADPAEGPVQEMFAILAGLAGTVPRVRLGSLVAGNTYRNPAMLAKIAASIDQMCEGRLVLGLGAGWQENEHRAYGIEFNSFGWRFDRLEEACEVVTSLFANSRTSFTGKHYTLVDAPLDPKPVQQPIPLLIGGGGERRTLRIAARYAQQWNVWGEPDLLAQKGAVLDRHCEAEGRDPASIRRSAQALLFLSEDPEVLARIRGMRIERPKIVGNAAEVGEIVGRYRDAGVDELIVPGHTFRSAGEREDTLGHFLADVAAPYR